MDRNFHDYSYIQSDVSLDQGEICTCLVASNDYTLLLVKNGMVELPSVSKKQSRIDVIVQHLQIYNQLETENISGLQKQTHHISSCC